MHLEWAPGIDISMTPVRRVVGRSAQTNNGWHRSGKHPLGYLPGESPPELTFLMFAELDPNVTLMTAQPQKIPFSFDDRLCEHVPDFAVMEAGESLIFEVKSERQYEKVELKRRLRAAARSIEARGWPYYVVLMGDMLSHPLYSNIDDLWRRHRRNYSDLQKMAVENIVISGVDRVRDIVREVERSYGIDPVEDRHVLSMAANGALFIDLAGPVGPDSRVRMPDMQELPDPFIPRRRPVDDLPWEVVP